MLNSFTVCSELKKNGFMTKKEWELERAYAREFVPRHWIIVYKIVIFPIVMLMKVCPPVCHIVSPIARFVWINPTLKKVTVAMKIKRLRDKLIGRD